MIITNYLLNLTIAPAPVRTDFGEEITEGERFVSQRLLDSEKIPSTFSQAIEIFQRMGNENGINVSHQDISDAYTKTYGDNFTWLIA